MSGPIDPDAMTRDLVFRLAAIGLVFLVAHAAHHL